MTSILTNTGAMIALQSLQATDNNLSNVQNQISTGLAIQGPSQNAAVWTVATTMQANVASLNQVSSDLGNADSILGTAVSGATQITSLVSQIRAQVASYTDTATNQTATQASVAQLVNQIQATVSSSSFNGVDLLDGTQSNGLTFMAATNNSYAGGATSPTITVANTATANLGTTGTAAAVSAFFTLLTSSGLGAITSQTALDGALSTIDSYMSTVQTQASSLGSTQSNVSSQQIFVQNLASTFTTGAGNMVDANMEAESAQLTALQTQQQLGAQALSIANQAPQMILKLFGG
ncbi:flagellin N-terminal helical domain-containing protein [Rhodopila globiformis]|nr:flagellin [Rhodopila globiformis]